MASVEPAGENRCRERVVGWEIARAAPGAVTTATAADSLAWQPLGDACTVAAFVARQGIDPYAGAIDLDAFDWWYRVRLAGDAMPGARLVFEALAGRAEVWIDGDRRLEAGNAFVPWVIPLHAGAREIVVRFASLGAALAARRPRPRWKTRLVAHQQLRWFRTSLLGRMPGWCPPVPTIGLAGPVRIERDALLADRPVVRTTLVEGRGDVSCTARSLVVPEGATLVVAGVRIALAVTADAGGGARIDGAGTVGAVAAWWPHTHGAQPLHEATLELRVAGTTHVVPLGRIGFRSVRVDAPAGDFAFVWNGQRVFMRGAVWTPLDLVAGCADAAALRRALEQMRDAGMNMVRVAGITTYESDTFHDLCDALGITVWQDAMFANMDYPAGDAAFEDSVRAEMRALGARLAGRPSTAFVCGSSEVAQQVAMLGLPPEVQSSALFDAVIPEALAAALPDVPYVPSTPWGGALPFHPHTGIAHYYGVGAYLRDPDDARRADVKFAAETLAFSNVPEPVTVEALLGDGEAPPTHPRWKARVPRDRGVGWDFEDVREHYVGRLFRVDPAALRHADVTRWLALGRVATGAMMEHTFTEWRRHGSSCAGGLVFMLRDPWPGAGWGVVDAHGRPKAAWFALRRVLQPLALLVTDEGLNGLALHVVNDRPETRTVDVSLTLYRHGETVTCTGTRRLTVAGGATLRIDGDALLERFADTTQAYRFGPPGHDVAVARMSDAATGAFLGDAFHFPAGPGTTIEPDVGLSAAARATGAGTWIVTLTARRLAQWVWLETEGAEPLDNYVHLAPGVPREIAVRALPDARTDPSRWRAHPLNAAAQAKVTVGPAN
jgi:beta-mannosidase